MATIPQPDALLSRTFRGVGSEPVGHAVAVGGCQARSHVGWISPPGVYPSFSNPRIEARLCKTLHQRSPANPSDLLVANQTC
jgi:hypothetical protein